MRKAALSVAVLVACISSSRADDLIVFIPDQAPGDLAEAPQGPLPSIFVNSCQEITKPGHYVLNADLVGRAACLSIHDTQDIVLDCGGHSIVSNEPDRAVDVTNVKRLVIENCSIYRHRSDWLWPGPSAPRAFPPPALKIQLSDSIQLIGSTVGRLDAEYSTRTVLAGDDISGGYTQFHSSQTRFENNTVHHPDSIRPIVWLQAGTGNYVVRNSIDGEWHGAGEGTNEEGFCALIHCAAQPIGADDGLLLFDENSDVVGGNLIQNTYDAGIESVGLLKESQILQNTIRNCYNAGVSTYWGSSWLGNRVAGNLVEDAPRMISFTYKSNSYIEHVITHLYFQDNTIENNVFRQSASPSIRSTEVDAGFFLGLYLGYRQSDISVGNNLIRGNDFGLTSPAPYFGPSQDGPPPNFIDGGGNICPPAVPASAIACYPPANQP